VAADVQGVSTRRCRPHTVPAKAWPRPNGALTGRSPCSRYIRHLSGTLATAALTFGPSIGFRTWNAANRRRRSKRTSCFSDPPLVVAASPKPADVLEQFLPPVTGLNPLPDHNADPEREPPGEC